MGRAQDMRRARKQRQARTDEAARARRAERDPDAQRAAAMVYAAVLDAKAQDPRDRLGLPPAVWATLSLSIEQMALGWIRTHELPETEEQAREVAAWLMQSLRDMVALSTPAHLRDWQQRMEAFAEAAESPPPG